MPESLSEITHTTKTGPIHLPKDGRVVEVEVQHLVKTFGKQEAVKDISFTIGRGEIFGLLGPNGAGKSTTINIMCGYLEPTSGDTLIDGQSVTREPRKVKRMIGVVPQEIALYNDLNALENLEFFGEIYGLSSQKRKKRAQALLHFVGLYDRRKEPVKKFSGRRTFMASTLLREHVALRKLLLVGPLTIVSTVIVNLIIRFIAVSIFGVPETFQYLQAAYVIGSTIVFLLVALLAFVLVNRFARRPIRFYRILAFVVLCISFLSPVMALVGLFPAPGMTLSIFWTMIVMHLVSAIIVVGLFTTLTRE
jgi:ABC-type lipopolysaccharide export system ATPase subunit